MTSNQRGIIYMVMSAFSFVSCDSFLKLLLQEVPPFQSIVLRGVFAAACSLGLVVALGQAKHLPKAFNIWTILRSLTEVTAISSFVIALASVPMADVTAIYQVAPLFVLAGASFIWGEKIGLLRWGLILFGLVGALVVAQPGREGASPLALLGFITAAGSAARDLLSRKTPHDAPGPVITFSLVLIVLLSGVVNTYIFETWVPVRPMLLVFGLGAGVFVMLGHLFVFLAFRHAKARVVAPFYYCFTLFAGVFGVVFFKEYPNSVVLFGMAMIIASGLAVLYFERGEKPS
jgi:drug/metabolite transporter (DMT)-like permease